MTNLELQLLILTVLLIYFGVFMTQSIYKQCEKPIYAKLFFAANHKVTPIALLNNKV